MTFFASIFAQLTKYVSSEVVMIAAMIAVGVGTAAIIFILGYPIFCVRKKQEPEAEDLDEDPGIFGTITPALAGVIPEREKETREFNQLLRGAGFYQPGARNTIYALRLLLLIVPIFMALYLCVLEPKGATMYVSIGIFTGVALMIIPRLYVQLVQKRRYEEIRRGLADTIDMFGMCASGGMTTSESLEHVSEQLEEYPELARELRILRRQADVGGLESAVADLVSRVNIREMRQFANLLLRGSRLGNQMAGTMNEQADHLRVTRRHMAIAQANKTPTKLVFPLMFCFAPAALIMLLTPALLDVVDFLESGEDLSPSTITEAMDGTTQSEILDIGISSEN
ncbi:MAG: type II secretion system F family protein [Planctomycetia bacterium]|nr:type II secretion system F family protein [Planctomycetia bacterium]